MTEFSLQLNRFQILDAELGYHCKKFHLRRDTLLFSSLLTVENSREKLNEKYYDLSLRYNF